MPSVTMKKKKHLNLGNGPVPQAGRDHYVDRSEFSSRQWLFPDRFYNSYDPVERERVDESVMQVVDLIPKGRGLWFDAGGSLWVNTVAGLWVRASGTILDPEFNLALGLFGPWLAGAEVVSQMLGQVPADVPDGKVVVPEAPGAYFSPGGLLVVRSSDGVWVMPDGSLRPSAEGLLPLFDASAVLDVVQPIVHSSIVGSLQEL